MPDFGKMMKQMQKLQESMDKLQKELEAMQFTHTAGGGMVTATVNGKLELINIKVDPQVIDPNDPEMLEDMIIAAVNGAAKEANRVSQERMSILAGGLGGLPGMM